MDYFYLVASVFLASSTSITNSLYNRKNKDKKGISAFFNLILIISVFCSWLVLFLIDGTADVSVLPYSVMFAVSYTLATVGLINALKTGSVMLSSLFSQLSLIVASIWGFFFWNEQFTWLSGIGLVLTVIAICLCLINGKEEKKKLSLKWIFYVVMAFVGNAGCSIVQRTQQIDCGGKHGNFFMLIAIGSSIAVFVVLYIRSDKSDSAELARTSWYFPVAAGVLNAALNLFVIIMATSSLSASLIYPTIAVGSLAVVTIFSLFVMKEKMRWWQWVGVALGAIATGILSV